jgi:hypothetical protein
VDGRDPEHGEGMARGCERAIWGGAMKEKESETVQRAARAAEWVRSPEGQRAMSESRQKAERLAELFRQAERVDPALWDKEVR